MLIQQRGLFIGTGKLFFTEQKSQKNKNEGNHWQSRRFKITQSSNRMWVSSAQKFKSIKRHMSSRKWFKQSWCQKLGTEKQGKCITIFIFCFLFSLNEAVIVCISFWGYNWTSHNYCVCLSPVLRGCKGCGHFQLHIAYCISSPDSHLLDSNHVQLLSSFRFIFFFIRLGKL